MHIILVDWKIIPGKEDDFKQYWRETLPVDDRSRMIGEFLSSVSKEDQYPWITWDLSEDGDYTRFINVGLWADAEAFQEQIGKYFNPVDGSTKPFEFKIRHRALLSPECWRMGDWNLPIHDSGGVL